MRYEDSPPAPLSSFPFPHTGTPQRGAPGSFTRERSDREVIETMTRDGKDSRGDAHAEAHTVLC
jgi:hypothetical protein